MSALKDTAFWHTIRTIFKKWDVKVSTDDDILSDELQVNITLKLSIPRDQIVESLDDINGYLLNSLSSELFKEPPRVGPDLLSALEDDEDALKSGILD